MASIVDRLIEFRGTRPARAIAAAIFLGLGLYNLAYGSGSVEVVVFGAFFTAVGLLGAYRLLAGESVVESVRSWR